MGFDLGWGVPCTHRRMDVHSLLSQVLVLAVCRQARGEETRSYRRRDGGSYDTKFLPYVCIRVDTRSVGALAEGRQGHGCFVVTFSCVLARTLLTLGRQVDANGELLAVTWAPMFEGVQMCSAKDMALYNSAHAEFLRLIEEGQYAESFTVRERLEPGQCLVFNNRRMLHGREVSGFGGLRSGKDPCVGRCLSVCPSRVFANQTRRVSQSCLSPCRRTSRARAADAWNGSILLPVQCTNAVKWPKQAAARRSGSLPFPRASPLSLSIENQQW